MKKKKLKGFVLPTLYLLITISIFTGIIVLGSDFELRDKEYDYGTPTIIDNTHSVILEDTTATSDIVSPVKEGTADIAIHYYNYKDNEERQKNSLIYYENTYLPNTGTLYTSDKEFEVSTVFPGKVSEIKEDEFFGKVIVVEHTENLKTYYYGLDQIVVEKDADLTEGALLGISKNNTIMNTKKTFLLEVYYNNELINPETFIGTKITDYK